MMRKLRLREKIVGLLVAALLLSLIVVSTESRAFTISSTGYANNSPTGNSTIRPGQTNILLFDFNLPDPNNDTVVYTGTEALSAGDALTALANNIYFADNDDNGLYNDTTDEAIVSSTDTILDNADVVLATGTAALLAFTGEIYYFDANADGAYTNGEAIVSSTDTNLTVGRLNGSGSDVIYNNGAVADLIAFATSTFTFDHCAGAGCTDDNSYTAGETIFRDQVGPSPAAGGTHELNGSSSDVLLLGGNADFTKITADIVVATSADAFDIRLTKNVTADTIWEWGEYIFVDFASDGWTTSSDIILVEGNTTFTFLDEQVYPSTTVDAVLDTAGFNIGFLDSNHNGKLDISTSTEGATTSSEPIVRTATVNQPDDYKLTTNDVVLTAASSTSLGGKGKTIAGDWKESGNWLRLSTLVDVGHFNTNKTGASATSSITDYYTVGEAVIKKGGGVALDGNVSSTDTVLVSGTAGLTAIGVQYRFCDSNHNTLYTTTTQEAIVKDVTADADAYDAKLSEDDTVVTAGACDLVAFTSAYTSPKFDDSDGTGIIATNGSDSIVLDDDSSGYYRGDKLSSVKVNNLGTAVAADVLAIKIWEEDGTTSGFQASGDTVIGTGTNFGTAISTASLASVHTAASKNRIYVTLNVSTSAGAGRVVQPQIPAGTGTNAGVQLASSNDGPTDAPISSSILSIVGLSPGDTTAPSSVITTPSAATTIPPGVSYTIKGYSTDSGGSSVREVKISLDNGVNWLLATSKASYSPNGFTWEYIWQNPSEGTYTLKARAEDHMGNMERPAAAITVTVAVPTVATTTAATTTPEVTPTPTTTPEVTPTPTPTPTPAPTLSLEKPISQMTAGEIQAKITEIIAVIKQLKEMAEALPATTPAALFQNNLKYGQRGDEVRELQEALIKEGLLAGGLNTGWFGPLTKEAVIAFQEKYASDILAPWALNKGTGFVGKTTRAKLLELYGQ